MSGRQGWGIRKRSKGDGCHRSQKIKSLKEKRMIEMLNVRENKEDRTGKTTGSSS